MMTIEENKKVVLRFNKEFLEKGNTEVLKEIVADGFINHTAPPGFANDVNGLIDVVRMLHKGFSDILVEIHDLLGEGGMVATRKTIHATHSGEIMGKQATGKIVSINVMDFVHLLDGKYTNHWGRNDLIYVIQKL